MITAGFIGITNYVSTGGTPPTYATLNPFDKDAGVILSGGNLTAQATDNGVRSTISVNTGTEKKYCEVTLTTVGFHMLGLAKSAWNLTDALGGDSNSGGMWQDDGHFLSLGSDLGFGNGGSSNSDVIGIAINLGTLSFYRNGSLLGTSGSGYSGAFYIAYWGGGSSSTVTFNFGASSFIHTPPAGHTGIYS